MNLQKLKNKNTKLICIYIYFPSFTLYIFYYLLLLILYHINYYNQHIFSICIYTIVVHLFKIMLKFLNCLKKL